MRDALVLGATTVVGAMPPKAISNAATLPSLLKVKLNAAFTIAMSSSRRLDCLYAAKYWFYACKIK